MGVKDSGRFVAAAVAAYHDTKTSIAPFPRVPITLMTLREQGHNIYVATQGTSIKQWDKLIRLGIALYFDGVFVSEDIGRTKDELFFKEVLKRLGSKPSDCMMVGDREDADIAPAKAVGILTVRVLQGKRKDTPSGADHVITDMEQLLEILK